MNNIDSRHHEYDDNEPYYNDNDFDSMEEFYNENRDDFDFSQEEEAKEERKKSDNREEIVQRHFDKFNR